MTSLTHKMEASMTAFSRSSNFSTDYYHSSTKLLCLLGSLVSVMLLSEVHFFFFKFWWGSKGTFIMRNIGWKFAGEVDKKRGIREHCSKLSGNYATDSCLEDLRHSVL